MIQQALAGLESEIASTRGLEKTKEMLEKFTKRNIIELKLYDDNKYK